MGELEDQIARLAQHRADQVPAYRAPASLDRARVSRRGVWLAAAAITAAVVAAGAFLWSRGNDASVRTGPSPATEVPAPTTIPPTTPTTPPTTNPPAPATCPDAPDATTSPKSGGAGPSSQLLNVQIQTSACVDEVTFQFRDAPGWSVEYRAGPPTLEPSGQPVDIEGSAFLIVRFAPAEGDRAGAGGLPQDLHAGPLSHITEVRQTQDFEGVLTWVIGLDGRVPFAVDERTDDSRALVVVRFPASGVERTITCSDPAHHLEYTVPSGWYVELNDDDRCHALGPSPFTIVRNADLGVPVSLGTGGASLAETLASPSVASSSSTPVTVDGRAGTCAEGEYSGYGFYSRGTRFYSCEIPWGDAGVFGVVFVADGPAFNEYRAAVQAILASARYLP